MSSENNSSTLLYSDLTKLCITHKHVYISTIKLIRFASVTLPTNCYPSICLYYQRISTVAICKNDHIQKLVGSKIVFSKRLEGMFRYFKESDLRFCYVYRSALIRFLLNIEMTYDSPFFSTSRFYQTLSKNSNYFK